MAERKEFLTEQIITYLGNKRLLILKMLKNNELIINKNAIL